QCISRSFRVGDCGAPSLPIASILGYYRNQRVALWMSGSQFPQTVVERLPKGDMESRNSSGESVHLVQGEAERMLLEPHCDLLSQLLGSRRLRTPGDAQGPCSPLNQQLGIVALETGTTQPGGAVGSKWPALQQRHHERPMAGILASGNKEASGWDLRGNLQQGKDSVRCAELRLPAQRTKSLGREPRTPDGDSGLSARGGARSLSSPHQTGGKGTLPQILTISEVAHRPPTPCSL